MSVPWLACHTTQSLVQLFFVSTHVATAHVTCRLKAVGLQVDCRVMCDTKKSAQKFLNTARSSKFGCLFENIEQVRGRQAPCLKHDRECKISSSRPDMVCIWPPCQPFSGMRDKSKIPPPAHKDYHVTFHEFLSYVEEVRPHGGLVEQVPGFGQPYYASPRETSTLMFQCMT